MKNYNRNNKPGNGRNRDYNRRDSGRPAMHQAVCDQCGRDCEVPFRPTGGKPIYCSDCFKNIEPRQSGGRDFKRPGFGDKKMYRAVCDKCGKDCEVPFRPTEGKPVYCNNCFVRDDKPDRKNSHPANDQFILLNAKLDKILKILDPGSIKAESKKKEMPAKQLKIKPKKVADKKKKSKKK